HILYPHPLSLPPPPTSPLFPYTTLFRSSSTSVCGSSATSSSRPRSTATSSPRRGVISPRRRSTWASTSAPSASSSPSSSSSFVRSEEHTSELQSRENLVCRLLLEKKKQR